MVFMLKIIKVKLKKINEDMYLNMKNTTFLKRLIILKDFKFITINY